MDARLFLANVEVIMRDTVYDSRAWSRLSAMRKSVVRIWKQKIQSIRQEKTTQDVLEDQSNLRKRSARIA
jgi:hypothetical protein